MAHRPIPELVYKAQVSDKTIHFLAYLILIFLLWFSIKTNEKVKWSKKTVWAVFCIAVVYGIVDEKLQGYVGRNCNIMDFWADLAGSITSLVLFTFLSFWPAFLAVTGISIFLLTNLAKANLSTLVPLIDSVFHVLAYALFTVLWIKNIQLYLPRIKQGVGRLLLVLAVPAALLFIVKLATVLIGKELVLKEVFLSLAAIVITALLWRGVKMLMAVSKPNSNEL